MRLKVTLALALAVGWIVVILSIAAVTAALGLRPTPGATSSLLYALPAPSESGTFGGYDTFTAADLNRVKHGNDLRWMTYVDADEPSTKPGVVSVNAIDRFTWGAAALSDQNGRCYVILAIAEHDQPQFGSTRYGRLPAGSPCRGAQATPATATADEWPVDEASDLWLDILVGIVSVLPPALLLFALAARARRRGAGHFVRHLPLLVGTTLGWFVALIAIVGSLDNSWSEFGLSNYVGAAAWAALAGAVVEAGAIGALAPRSAALEARVGLGLLGAVLLGIPLAFVVMTASII